MSAKRKENPAKIKVFGVGGGGMNAVNRMIASGIRGVEFWGVNTDKKSLKHSFAENILQIGPELTKGMGVGAKPEVGQKAAEESEKQIEKALSGADMVFLAAGMGGGTGTGALPVIAKIAKQMGCLTLAVVTRPFRFEGRIKATYADCGIDKLKDNVDALNVVQNETLLKLSNSNVSITSAFEMADEVLKQGVKSISDTIHAPGLINLDLADIKTIMMDAGSVMMGIGSASGSDRAVKATYAALNSALLDQDISGAKGLILNFTGLPDLTLQEINSAFEVIHNYTDPNANIIFGAVIDEKLKEEISVTVIATQFDKTKKKITSPTRSHDLELPLFLRGRNN